MTLLITVQPGGADTLPGPQEEEQVIGSSDGSTSAVAV